MERRMTRATSRVRSTEEATEMPNASGSDQRVMHDISNFTVSRNDSESEEEKDDGKAEVEDETSPLSTPLPQFLKGILQDLDVKEDIKQLNSVLTTKVTPTNYKAVLFEGNTLDTTGMSKEEQLMILSGYLSSKASIASCYPAATRLLELVGAKDQGESYNGGEEAGSFSHEDQVELISDLCKDLQDAVDQDVPVIFKVQLGGKNKGGHGFTLTIQNGNIYKIEAFAGIEQHAKMMVTDIMKNGKKYSIDTVTNALSLIASSDVQDREKGAAMLGWSATGIALITSDETAITNPMNVFWTAYPLASADEIREQVAAQIQETQVKLLRIVQNKRQKK